MNEKEILTLSLRDLFTTKMLKYSLVPFVLTMVVMYIVFFAVAGMGLEHMGTMNVHTTQTSMQNGIAHTESVSAELEGSAIMDFLMSYAITSWIATFLVYAIGGFLTLYLSIFVAIIIIGFLTPYVLKEIQRTHYKDVEMIGHSNLISGVFLLIKHALIMIFLFLVLIPLYFIPLVNIIALNFPLYYFFHKMMLFDISSNIATQDEEKQIRFFNSTKLRLKTLALYIISLIPFVIFFAAVFFVIYLGHTYFLEIKKIRQKKISS